MMLTMQEDEREIIKRDNPIKGEKIQKNQSYEKRKISIRNAFTQNWNRSPHVSSPKLGVISAFCLSCFGGELWRVLG